jgi:hypothetical protein
VLLVALGPSFVSIEQHRPVTACGASVVARIGAATTTFGVRLSRSHRPGAHPQTRRDAVACAPITTAPPPIVTTPPPLPPARPPVIPVSGPLGSVTLDATARKVRASAGRVKLTFACPSPYGCRAVKLTAAGRVRIAGRLKVRAIAAGSRQSIGLALNAKAQRAVRKAGRRGVTLTITGPGFARRRVAITG